MKKTVEAAGFQFTFEAKAIFNKERVPYDPHQSLVSKSISHRCLSNQLLPFVCVIGGYVQWMISQWTSYLLNDYLCTCSK